MSHWKAILMFFLDNTLILGTATGGGTTIDTNQRLMLSHLGHKWKDDPEKGGDEPFIDAQIVGWNMRDKKTANGPMTFLRPKNFDFDAGKHHFTPIYEQSKYKYLVYVDGHCAACRYGFMMRLGSVILKVRFCGILWCGCYCVVMFVFHLNWSLYRCTGCTSSSGRHDVVLSTSSALCRSRSRESRSV